MAKPNDWDAMNADEKREYALHLRSTMRGKLILGQALAKAIQLMKQAEYPEYSNMEDMEIIGLLYEPWFTHHSPEGEKQREEMVANLAAFNKSIS